MNLKNIFRTEVDTFISINKLSHTDSFILLGSCFSNQMSKYFNNNCFSLLNPFGTIYNPISLQQNFYNAINKKIFKKSDLLKNGEIFLSWNHSGTYYNKYENLLLKEINDEQQKIYQLIKKNATIIVTFGTSYIYELISNKKIVANCHKKSSTIFNKRRLSVIEIVNSWREILKSIDNQVIFTVSPVRHIREGLIESNLSKSILLLAVNELCNEFDDQTHYFPSYELLMDELRDYRFYDPDWIHPSKEATDFIWEKLSSQLFSNDTLLLIEEINKVRKNLAHQPKFGKNEEYLNFLNKTLNMILKIKGNTNNYDWSKEISYLKSNLKK